MIDGVRVSYERAGRNAVLICPPHPKFGGSMHDVRLMRISRRLVGKGISTLRFDYRSVKSALKDAEICFEWLKGMHEKVGVIGYSFGSIVASNICGDCLVLISPLRSSDGYVLKDCKKPKLIVIAKRDQFLSIRESLELVRSLSEPKEVVILDTDHLYVGKLDVLTDVVSKFVLSQLESNESFI